MDDRLNDFLTIRDLFRHAVSRFNAANLSYGHGTTDAVDEAAFMVLEALHLPIDRLDPFADARLTRAERARVLALIDARVESRQPAPYLLGAAYQHGLKFIVDRNVLIPRSFIGDLLHGDDLPLAAAPQTILDLCTGSGCLAVLAALVWPEARVDAADLSAAALDVARRNVERHGLTDRIALHQGDLFAPLGKARYDLIVTNPPYVDALGMARLTPEHRHEPAMALAAGDDGLDLVRRILGTAKAHLTKQGGLLCEVGRGRANIEAEWPDTPFLWLDTELSEGEVFFLPAKALR